MCFADHHEPGGIDPFGRDVCGFWVAYFPPALIFSPLRLWCRASRGMGAVLANPIVENGLAITLAGHSAVYFLGWPRWMGLAARRNPLCCLG